MVLQSPVKESEMARFLVVQVGLRGWGPWNCRSIFSLLPKKFKLSKIERIYKAKKFKVPRFAI